ncbi:hypothetical protein [Roseovarius aestuariivivens]|uniref:hypothetical protein n=1 Tax=Roseovarius aestuariivivens TaxID=1888910 RepID=UPI0010812A03|nr:hypothetical protein [Roseovarius aestuariivivens]
MSRSKFHRVIQRQVKKTILTGTSLVPDLVLGQRMRQALIPHTRQKQFQPVERSPLERLHGKYKGKRCLIIGTAPSVSSQDLAKLDPAYTFLLNRAYLLNNRSQKSKNALVLANPLAFEEYGRDALRHTFEDVFLSSGIPTKDHPDDPRVFYYSQWVRPKIYEGFFQTDLSQPLYQGTSVAFTAIQIAFCMGFSDIILAGIEFNFDQKEPHFYNSTEAEAERAVTTSRVNADYMIDSLRYCCRFIGSHADRKISSVSPNRNLGFMTYAEVASLPGAGDPDVADPSVRSKDDA